MYVQRLTDYVSDCHSGVERSIGVLENYLHLAPVREHVSLDFLFAVKNHVAVVDNSSGRRFRDSEDGASGRSLSAS